MATRALSVQLSDGNAALYARAKVYAAGTLVATVSLPHVAGGLYAADTTLSPGSYVAVYALFTDAGFTTPSTDYELTEERVEVPDAYPVAPTAAAVSAAVVAALPAYPVPPTSGAIATAVVAALPAYPVPPTTGAISAAVVAALPAYPVPPTTSAISAAVVAALPAYPTPPTASVIATALLDALLAGHLTAGSVGEAIALTLGLVQHNFVLDEPTYNPSGLLTSSRIRIFGSSADAGSGTNPIATFTTTSVADAAPNAGRPLSYKAVRTG